MESMTGYARAEGSTPQFSYSIEIKSLNNKYLETYVNLPRSLSSEELYFVELLKKHFVRGKVELGIELFGWSASRGSSIDTELLKRYCDELSAFRKKNKVDEGFSLDAVLSLDGVVQKGRSSISPQSIASLKKAVVSAGKQANADFGDG